MASASVPPTSLPPAPSALAAPAASLADLPPRIVFFDGVCAFCDGSIRWLMDRGPRLCFAPLQGETAALVREAFPDRFPKDIDTLVYFRPDDQGRPEISLRSAAIFEILQEIGGILGAVAWLRWLPRGLTDWGYRVFARNRYGWFGQLESCRIPSPEEQARSLD